MAITLIEHYAMLTGSGFNIETAIQLLEVKINECFREGYTMYDDWHHIQTTAINGGGVALPYHCFLQVMVKRDRSHGTNKEEADGPPCSVGFRGHPGIVKLTASDDPSDSPAETTPAQKG